MSDGNAEMSGKAKEPRDQQQQEATQDEGQRKAVMSSEFRIGRHLGEETWNQARSCPRRPGTMA